MNNTITLSQLITRLAAVTGVDNNTARRFLRALFATVEDTLAEGHSVNIKGVGTFRPVTDEFRGTGITVAFTPDKDIAAELNKPFEMFTAVELADGVTFEEEKPSETPVETPVEETYETPVTETIPEPVDVVEPEVPVEPRTETTTLRWPEEEEEEQAQEVETPREVETFTTPEPDEPAPHEAPRRNLLWLWISLILLAVCIGAYLVAVYTTPIPKVETGDTDEAIATSADSLIEEVSVDEIATPQASTTPEPQAKPETAQTATPAATPKPEAEPAQAKAKEPVYDTVDVSLIRLAKKHYGESSYWVFIYEANTDIISNPNRIRPGQKVLIPDRSTFPGATTAETRSIANKKQAELLNRFK